MEHKNIYQLVLAGVLCAIGLVVPMVMPKVIIGPMSFILGAGTVLHYFRAAVEICQSGSAFYQADSWLR